MQGLLPIIAQEDGGGIAAFLPLILIVVVFYFLLIRPQQKRTRQQRELVNSLDIGDEVVSAGGLHGRITGTDDSTVRLEVSPGTTITMEKNSIVKRQVHLDDDVDVEDDD